MTIGMKTLIVFFIKIHKNYRRITTKNNFNDENLHKKATKIFKTIKKNIFAKPAYFFLFDDFLVKETKT